MKRYLCVGAKIGKDLTCELSHLQLPIGFEEQNIQLLADLSHIDIDRTQRRLMISES